ncbi:MAG: hypothetical protein DWQ04_17670 [Chloroflexi bacterium]|nr:MAG: hypothetical protein DWQ04_17670 [Chloroflexota bacterium]
MIPAFPAVIVGGPPHSGKSVLVYSLTKALRAINVPHYVLRACPDGEGDWANEADQSLVNTLRIKGEFTPAFTKKIDRFLQQRHMPLIVDVGGLPNDEQQALFRHATHAILLVGEDKNAPVSYSENMAYWQNIMTQQGVAVIAQIKSVLHGENQLISSIPILTGVMAGLERGQIAIGPVFDAVIEKLSDVFAYDSEEILAYHMAQSPVEITLDLPSLAQTLGTEDGYWQPNQLVDLWDYLPTKTPLGVYGRSANWVYAALAMIAYPEPVWLFDVRLGWVQPPELSVGNLKDNEVQTGWDVSAEDYDSFTMLHMKTHAQYLDIDDAQKLPLVAVPRQKGVIVSGKIPQWLVMAVIRQVAPGVPWTAVYQPPLGCAVVVHSQNDTVLVGKCIPV